MIRRMLVAETALPPVRREELLRYAAAKSLTPALSAMLEEALAEAERELSCRICWREMSASELAAGLPGGTFPKNQLKDCQTAVVFAATLGIGLDRLILRYGKTSPTKALLLQAIGAERTEALCDHFCRRLADDAAGRGLHTTRRFSPGYGDLPLTAQRELFLLLDCERQIGLTLNQSLVMTPSKSVTAIVGIGKSCHPCSSGCGQCAKTDCIYRRHL